MSSSLFDTCYGDYPSCRETFYEEGDKKFKEVVKGDILYFVSPNGTVEEVVANNTLRKSGLNLMMSIIRNNKRTKVDFGYYNCTFAFETPNNSILPYNGGYFGTNKNSLINRTIRDQEQLYQTYLRNLNTTESNIYNLKKNLEL